MWVERNGNFPVHALVVRASNNSSENQHPQNIAYVDVSARWAGINGDLKCNVRRCSDAIPRNSDLRNAFRFHIS